MGLENITENIERRLTEEGKVICLSREESEEVLYKQAQKLRHIKNSTWNKINNYQKPTYFNA